MAVGSVPATAATAVAGTLPTAIVGVIKAELCANHGSWKCSCYGGCCCCIFIILIGAVAADRVSAAAWILKSAGAKRKCGCCNNKRTCYKFWYFSSVYACASTTV